MINTKINSNMEIIRDAIISHLNNIEIKTIPRILIQKPINVKHGNVEYLECSPEEYLIDKEFSKTEIEEQLKISLKNLISYNICKK